METRHRVFKPVVYIEKAIFRFPGYQIGNMLVDLLG